jgi:hypothetical protein
VAVERVQQNGVAANDISIAQRGSAREKALFLSYLSAQD